MLKENLIKNYKIKDLLRVERPREKLISKGPENLKDEELLAILLRTGREGNKEESYLTLSVKLHEQDRKIVEEINKFQKRIMSRLKDTIILYDPYDIKESGGLLQYPEDRFHFSLINFLKCPYNFEKFKKLTRDDNNYKEIKQRIIEIISKNLPHKTEAKIKSLYNGSGSGINSFSLQISLEKRFIERLKKIGKEVKEEFENELKISFCNCVEDICIREYFPINILRFINLGKDKSLKEVIGNDMEKISDIVTDINDELFSHPIPVNINEIILVESDPFLYKWNKVKSFKLSELE